MAYKALYRSYRPTTFEAVVGQEYIIQTLKNALINNKTSHAYIFSGPRGIGKTTIARILAKAINCENPQNGEPCNKCASCRLINNNETPDIIEIDAASNNGVEEIRSVLERVNFLPSVLKHKVYIIDEVHMLSLSAFNALLKTLEEPPVHVMFVLATTEPHKIPATIISRCQRFDFKPLTPKEVKTNLVYIAGKEKIDIEDAALDTIAEACDGGMRDAIGVLDQVNAYSTKTITIEDVNNVTGSISNQKLIELMQALNEGLSTKAIEITNELISLGKEVSRLTQSLLQLCRDILFYQNTDSSVDGKIIYDDVAFKTLCSEINKKKLFYFIEVLSDVQNKIKYSLSQKIFLEVGLLKMATSTQDDYSPRLAVESTGTEGVVYSQDLEEKVSNLENYLNKIKSELVRLNLNEFKDETKNKLEAIENIIVNNNNYADNNLEERINQLETNVENLNNNVVKEEVSANNIYVENSEYEETVKFILSQIEELSSKVNNLSVDSKDELTSNEEVNKLQEQLNSLKTQVEEINNNYVEVENTLNEIILTPSEETQEMDIHKRENPYNEVIQNVVFVQEKYEEEQSHKEETINIEEEVVDELEFVEEPAQEEVLEKLEFVEEEPQTQVEEAPVIEEIAPEEPIQELKPQQVNLFDLVEEEVVEEIQEDVEEEIQTESEEIEIPNEMARPIDDFFTNPVFFDKPLVEEQKPQQVDLFEIVEEQKALEPIVEEPKQEETVLTFENEAQPEKDEYQLNCDADLLDKYLEFLALTRNTGTIEYTNCVVDTVKQLDAMKLDVEKFTQDKTNGVFLTNEDLKASANRAIKSFLSAMMNGNAMKVSNKDVAIGVLISENKEMIQAYRKMPEATAPVEFVVSVPTPVVKEELTPVEVVKEVIDEPVQDKVVVEPIIEEAIHEEPVQEQNIEEELQQENLVDEPLEEETVEEPAEEIQEDVEEEIIEDVPQDAFIEETPTQEESKPAFNLDNLVIKEEVVETKQEETQQYVSKTILDITPKKVEPIDDNPYAIEKIENIMHDSRSEISREERKIIIDKWNQLEDRVNISLAPIARFLREGQPVVNGNGCIIITYPNAMLCNHIMGEKQHFEAKQILKITFGKEYDFIALPENVWNDKRNEYRGQYQMGMRFPKLTPIDSPDLKIIKKSFVDEKSESYKQAVDLFGEDLIKKDEE